MAVHQKGGTCAGHLSYAEKKAKMETEVKTISWNYCKDPNEINRAIMSGDENWYGITAENIISITWDGNHGCYVVFWRADNG